MKKILKFINENPTFIICINCGVVFSIILKNSIWFFVYLGLAFATLNDKEIGKKQQIKKNRPKPQEAKMIKQKSSNSKNNQISRQS